MSKSALTIQKEIIKKEYEKSPLGIIEKELRAFYDGMVTKGEKLPEEFAKQVFEIREENEKRTEAYIDERLKLDREAVDGFLLEAMTREKEVLTNFNKGK